MNHYETLEVSANASQEVIRAAYKSLMQRYHPDRNPDNAEAARRALLVSQAYAVLSDSGRRAAYDFELKRQSAERSGSARDGGSAGAADRIVLVHSKSSAKDDKSSWFLWLLIALMSLSGWWLYSDSGQRLSPGLAANKAGQPSSVASDEGARTIPIFAEKLTIVLRHLEKSPEDSSKASEDAEHILFIPILGIKVGSFDADRAIAYIERNREMIIQKLVEQLAFANYEQLNKSDGEDYLKNLVLDIVGESTGSGRREDYPPSKTEAPARYGAVDVVLPKSFSVR